MLPLPLPIGPMNNNFESMEKGTRVKILPESHPHYDEYGTMTGEQKDIKHVGVMHALMLEECEHGVDIANPIYVLLSQIEAV